MITRRARRGATKSRFCAACARHAKASCGSCCRRVSTPRSWQCRLVAICWTNFSNVIHSIHRVIDLTRWDGVPSLHDRLHDAHQPSPRATSGSRHRTPWWSLSGRKLRASSVPAAPRLIGGAGMLSRFCLEALGVSSEREARDKDEGSHIFWWRVIADQLHES
jgi:hypothetical protein